MHRPCSATVDGTMDENMQDGSKTLTLLLHPVCLFELNATVVSCMLFSHWLGWRKHSIVAGVLQMCDAMRQSIFKRSTIVPLNAETHRRHLIAGILYRGLILI